MARTGQRMRWSASMRSSKSLELGSVVPSKVKAEPDRRSQALAAGRWLRRRAENISALLLVAMFLCFILQIVARYVFNKPLGWTDEVSVLCWIWCTLWGAAFVLREKDEVRFDIIYSWCKRTNTLHLHDHHRCCSRRPVRDRVAGHHQLRHLPQGRAFGLSGHPTRLSLFDLCNILGCRDHPL